MARSSPIYLDHNSTTPVDPRVLEAMLPCFTTHFGNPSSSIHELGWYAAELVTIAREQVAALINGKPEEIIFTSGATEANNLALKGIAERLRLHAPGREIRIVSCVTEHRSVLDPLATLERSGCRVVRLEVDREGMLSHDRFCEELGKGASLVSLMLGNNEIGSIHPIAHLATSARAAGAIVHCDATQALGKIAVDVHRLGIDLLSLSAHKLYGPKGAGALWIRSALGPTALMPIIEGGGQELGLRSGTMNVPCIVGLGRAAEVAQVELDSRRDFLRQLAGRFLDAITESGLPFTVNGSLSDRLPGNLNLSFTGVESSLLLTKLQGKVAFSVSSACQSASKTPSHVLAALGLRDDEQRSSFRLGFGMTNSFEEIDRAGSLFIEAASALRK